VEEDEQQYQKRLQKRIADVMKRTQLEERKKAVIKRLTEPAAYERLMNIKASNPELYGQLVDMMISIIQSNRVAGKITEQQLVSLLERMTARNETTIEFRHK
jgi:programmed cell death protein 5